jgi:hypothetical protein
LFFFGVVDGGANCDSIVCTHCSSFAGRDR